MVTIKYKKTAAAVYISHIDIYRAIYRGIRRANLDVAYSKGYNPHAELFLSPPLPLFVYSDCEYFTADTKSDADEFFMKYSASAHNLLPPISRFYTAKNPNLAGKIFSADYLLEFSNPTVENRTLKTLGGAIEELLSQNEIIFTNRNGKSKNIRPYVYRAEFASLSTTINSESDAIAATVEKENYTIKINVDSTNLRAETVAVELEKLSGQRCKKITKTAQHVKTADKTIDADEYLSGLYSHPFGALNL
jgi:radical SAM-linked protein